MVDVLRSELILAERNRSQDGEDVAAPESLVESLMVTDGFLVNATTGQSKSGLRRHSNGRRYWNLSMVTFFPKSVFVNAVT